MVGEEVLRANRSLDVAIVGKRSGDGSLLDFKINCIFTRYIRLIILYLSSVVRRRDLDFEIFKKYNCLWGISSVGRTLHLQCRGQEFDSPILHHLFITAFRCLI